MKKKNNHFIIKFLLTVIGGLFVAQASGTAYLAMSTTKKMKKKPDGNNMMYSISLGKKKLEISPDTDNAYINCMTGVTELELKDLPIHYDLYIHLSSILAVFAIKIPAGVRISIEGTGKHVAMNNMVSEDIDECLPTVHVILDNANFTAINILAK